LTEEKRDGGDRETGDVAKQVRIGKSWINSSRIYEVFTLSCLVRRAGAQEQSGNLSAAIEALQQVVAIDPLHEEAQGTLMRLLVQTGWRQVALCHYQALRAAVQAVQREFHAEPAASL
jgi:DNA-binding SARP family transcriptional activator